MLDLKALKGALEQLEEERNISRDEILHAIEDALVAAYKKDYGKKSQIVKAKFNAESGQIDFYQVKIVVDESMLKPEDEEDEEAVEEPAATPVDGEPVKVRFNEDQHIMIEDARRIRKDVAPGEEMIFPLETRDDYGRIASQTAKQVILQRLREAEKRSVLEEYSTREGQIIVGKVQKIERGNVFVDMGRVTGFLPAEEQIPGEYYRQGERIKAYLYQVEETPRGINLRLSRAHPKFIEKLFEMEVPELSAGTVTIKAVAREPGSRVKIAVAAQATGDSGERSNRTAIDPVGAFVGQRGVRVNTVISELGGEKIDIIQWSEDPAVFIGNALSPAKIVKLDLNPDTREARIEVEPDQFSLAVGRRGQNVRLAAKLTGWKIDIKGPEGEAPAAENLQSQPEE